MVKSPKWSQVFGVFFSIAEKQIPQVVKFHHKKHCHYLSIYLFIYFKSFWLEWGLAMNIRAFMALKRGCHWLRSFTFLMNGRIALLFARGIWMDMKCLWAFHNRNTLRKFFKYSTLPNPWGMFLTSAVIHDYEHPHWCFVWDPCSL